MNLSCPSWLAGATRCAPIQYDRHNGGRYAEKIPAVNTGTSADAHAPVGSRLCFMRIGGGDSPPGTHARFFHALSTDRTAFCALDARGGPAADCPIAPRQDHQASGGVHPPAG